ncbi:MAG: hypothetical protein KI785_14630 [Devosiaceae bacterium]|nr:hypothetical protein [Devosiaceae bacterium MH13]
MTSLPINRLLVAGLVVAGTSVASLGVAEARTFTTEEVINRDRCYEAVLMPAIVEHNTRGIHVSSASRTWVGNPQVAGSHVIHQCNDPVFIQTRRIVDDQHITLVRKSC